MFDLPGAGRFEQPAHQGQAVAARQHFTQVREQLIHHENVVVPADTSLQ